MVILIKKENPNYSPDRQESKTNARYIEITDHQGINEEFHKAFQKLFNKQDVDDSSETIQEFLDYSGNTKPSEYLKSKVLADEEKNVIEGEITLSELQYALFTKMEGSSALGIDGFTVN